MNTAAAQVSAHDQLARALRQNDMDAFADASPAAACFLPLLRQLGWDGDNRDVMEALPHFASEMDLVDLRGVLSLLGYQSEPQEIRLNRVDMRLLPCLFECNDGKFFVITGYSGRDITVFSEGRHMRLDMSEAGLSGTAYHFTEEDVDVEIKQERVANWFTRSLLRFKKAFARLLFISFLINLLTISIPLFIMVIYDKVVGAHSLSSLPFLALGLAIVLFGDIRLRALRAEIIASVAGRLDYLTGVAAFEKILGFPPTMTQGAALTTQLARLREFKSLRDFFNGPLITTAVELPFVALVIITIYVLAGPVVWMPLAALVAFLVLGWLWLPQVRRTTLAFGLANTERSNFLMEATTHLATIKDLGAEDIWHERFRGLSARSLTLQDQLTREGAITEALTQGIVLLAGVGVLGLGAASVMTGDMTTGALIATMALLWRALGPFQSGFLALSRFREIRDSIRLVNQLMKLKSEETSQTSRLFDSAFEGDIKFQRISFRYNTASDPALLNVSFDIPKGKMVSILGPNSSGKSTILKLICGMYQPQGGSISIDGQDVRQINALDLRRRIAYVPQRPDIFYGTILQNLRLSDPLASQDEITHACDMVGLTDMIEALPEGFDTRIGDTRGDALPRGFLQRLSIARALVRRSQILLLDEPEQSLDDEGDRVFIELIKRLKGRVTIILVSHRPSHIKLADMALVLDKGAIEFAGEPAVALQASEIIASNLSRKTESAS